MKPSLDLIYARAQALTGHTVRTLAEMLQVAVPVDFRHDKGRIGSLVERYLGVTAHSAAGPDFAELGLEIKTIPVNDNGIPLESTFVCMLSLMRYGEVWQQSLVYRKLKQVLWIPVQGERRRAPAERAFARPVLWRPSLGEEAVLRQDWEEIMELVALGRLNQISARFGQYLQLRPKALNAKVLTSAFGEEGEPIQTLPRGFYLRRRFTERLLWQ